MTAPHFGNGTTVVFATSGFTMLITSIKPLNQKRDALKDDHLGTPAGGMPFSPAPLYDGGDLEITGFHNPDTPVPVTAPKEVVTVTFPPGTGQSTGGTIASDAFITENQIGDVKNNEYTMATIKLKRSGNVTRTSGAA